MSRGKREADETLIGNNTKEMKSYLIRKILIIQSSLERISLKIHHPV